MEIPASSQNHNEENVYEDQLPRIKVMQTVLKNFTKIGICPELVTQRYPINGRILWMVVVGIVTHILNGFYFLFDAETFLDYTQSIYACAVGILLSNVFVTLLANIETLYRALHDYELLVNTRKMDSKFINILLPFYFDSS